MFGTIFGILLLLTTGFYCIGLAITKIIGIFKR